MSQGRLTALRLVAAGAAVTLCLLPSGAFELAADPLRLNDWWEQHGTAAASIALLHLAVIAAMAATLALFALDALSRARRAPVLAGLASRILHTTPLSLRQRLLILGATSGLAVPAAATGDESILLIDAGPIVTAPAITLVDLGATPILNSGENALGPTSQIQPAHDLPTTRAGFRPPQPSGVPDAWLVEPGDDLWSIAATMLAEHAHADDEASIWRYWQALIEANRSTVPDPDLIQPGQVLQLPPIVTADR